MLLHSSRLAQIPGTPVADLTRGVRHQSIEGWRALLSTGGIASRGRRVFFTQRVGCAKCHTVDGRGGILEPDLSRVAQSKTRQQIIRAVLDPSAEFPPQYQAWAVVTTDGRIHRGLQLDHKSGGAIALTSEDGKNVYFKADEIDRYDVLQSSLMSSGLSEMMSVGELKDLIAFLESLRESG
jgi:putative heme-binding domain-containing protein